MRGRRRRRRAGEPAVGAVRNRRRRRRARTASGASEARRTQSYRADDGVRSSRTTASSSRRARRGSRPTRTSGARRRAPRRGGDRCVRGASDGGGFGPGSGFTLERRQAERHDVQAGHDRACATRRRRTSRATCGSSASSRQRRAGCTTGCICSPSHVRRGVRETGIDHSPRASSRTGVDSNEGGAAIEKALLAQGVQADSLRKLIDDFAGAEPGRSSYLIQGFMGIGLFVGIAAVGVIAFRTVVERRQQIGMLRAIGYTRQRGGDQLHHGVVVRGAAGRAERHRPGAVAGVSARDDATTSGGRRPELLHPVARDQRDRRRSRSWRRC